MILVTGANGMVGSYINWRNTIKTDIEDLDITNRQQVKSFKTAPITMILHLAAETDLEKCEKDYWHAYKVNTIGTYNMTALAVELNIPIVYISTAGVFDGKRKAPYTERCKPAPINVYGLTKWYGEEIVRAYPKHYIFRAGWMMGGGADKDKKFVAKITNKLKAGEKTIYALNDAWGSPTYAKDLVNVISHCHHIPYGTYHACGVGGATRFAVAKVIVNTLGYDVKVLPVPTDYYRTLDFKHSCKRSANETMSITKLQKAGLYMRPWHEALKDYLQEWK